MYNNKPRQAEGAPLEGGRTPEGRFSAAEGTPMWTMHALNSILGLYIILVLVLAVLPPKPNSAFGHARNKGVMSGSLQRAA